MSSSLAMVCKSAPTRAMFKPADMILVLALRATLSRIPVLSLKARYASLTGRDFDVISVVRAVSRRFSLLAL